MEVETSWSRSPSSVITISDDEMDEVWAEEIIIEEDGNPASPEWNPRDVLVLSPDGEGSPGENDSVGEDVSPTEDVSPVLSSPSFVIPDSLTDEENGLLDESFELMEDLMSKKRVEWNPDFIIDSDDGSIVDKAQALLDHLDCYVKQEPFPDWLEEKTELPLLEELGGYVSGYQSRAAVLPTGSAAVPYQPKHSIVPTPFVGQIAPQLGPTGLTLLTSAHIPFTTQVTDITTQVPVDVRTDRQTLVDTGAPLTPALIREFETVLHQTLTPPHTPPTYLDFVNSQEEESKPNAFAEEELDALIKSQVASLYEDKARFSGDWCESDVRESPPAAASDSPVSTPGACEDSDSATNSSSESDPDWAPSPSSPRSPAVRTPRNRRAVSSVEERKQRKKEQNKNAATRYRMKKKAEHADIVGEESVLLEKNLSLKDKATELQREVKYLKSLMKDICKAKGLI